MSNIFHRICIYNITGLSSNHLSLENTAVSCYEGACKCDGSCGLGEGDCDKDADCLNGLKCGDDFSIESWVAEDYCKAGVLPLQR